MAVAAPTTDATDSLGPEVSERPCPQDCSTQNAALASFASKRTILVNSNFSSKALPLRLLFLSGTYQRKLIPYSFLHDTLSNI